LLIASANGLLAVCLGAFGSHGLKSKLPENLLHAWATGVQYHFYHVFALVFVALLINQGIVGRWLTASAALYLGGILFFCGSLYWLALGGPRWLGPLTPLGGLCFILAWASLFIGVLQHRADL